MRVKAATVDYETRDRLVMTHLWLVKVLARRMAQRLPREVDIGELVSVGVLGLVAAAGRYRPALGVPFDAFARRRVHGAMLDALRHLDWVPRSVRRLRRELDTAVAQLRHQLGREPVDAEIASAMNLTPRRFEQAIEKLRLLEVVHLSALDASGPDGESLLNVVVDPDEGPMAQLERRELGDQLARALETLPDRERQILAMSYEHELTLAEIGDALGVSESRVCQLRALALSRLRAIFAGDASSRAAHRPDASAAARRPHRLIERTRRNGSRRLGSKVPPGTLEDTNLTAAVTTMARAQVVYRAVQAAAAEMQRLSPMESSR